MDASIEVSIRELKAKATLLIRQVEAGERVTITKRGRTMALLAPAAASTSERSAAASDSIYQTLRRRIEARFPAVSKATAAERAREFDRISRRMRRGLPYGTWK